MAGIEDVLKGNVVTGLAIGIGAAILAPVVAPLVASVGKPVAKSLIKSGILLFEKGQETFAELGEVMEDLVAEAKAELEGMGSAAGMAAGAETTTVSEGEVIQASDAAPGPDTA
jgi:hypothetical protein